MENLEIEKKNTQNASSMEKYIKYLKYNNFLPLQKYQNCINIRSLVISRNF